MPQPTHFTCTLGQAAELNEGKDVISNINAFVDHQASKRLEAPALAFPKPAAGGIPWGLQVFTFGDIQKGSSFAAEHFEEVLPEQITSSKTIALLCPSTARFLFAWLGLVRAGYSVLLVASQCQPAAIAHLMKSCSIDVLFYDEIYESQALNSIDELKNDADGSAKAAALPLPFDPDEETFTAALKNDRCTRRLATNRDENEIAYLFHTSGTSSGLPKPIPQTHRAAVGVLPQSLDGSQQALFTTTPLYHGGVSDLFRCWTSNAMICMFPGKGLPITAKNVMSCLAAVVSSQISGLPRVAYFASVPYVLQMMAADGEGLRRLQGMDMIGVGGAALPAEVGDDLVCKGINLISRFGSAECGFLLSSYREFEQDKEWQYLRASPDTRLIRFELQEAGLSELIVSKKWPHRAKTNREDGSYATSDLFAPHESIANAWRYHSRADSQLTLITGKKFDPSPIESSLATSPLLDDVLIFGNGQPYPGALLFRSEQAANVSDDSLVQTLAPAVEKLNAESQNHARLARNMLILMASGNNKLEKSSKGTIIRNKAEEVYADAIRQAYEGLNAGIDSSTPDDELPGIIAGHIKAVVGKNDDLHLDSDLFSFGVDSVASIQIRYMLQQLLPEKSAALPLSIVEDCGTVERLVDFIVKTRHGKDVQQEDELQLMRDLVASHGDFSSNNIPVQTDGVKEEHSDEANDKRKVVLLTGATGALGAHLLHLYRGRPDVSEIHLLVRGADDHAASERADKSLQSRGLPGLNASCLGAESKASYAKVTIHRAALAKSDLDLPNSTYRALQNSVTHMIHAAWSVNFRMRLRSFEKDHIQGLRHLLDLARSSQHQPEMAFISTLASVSATNLSQKDDGILERISYNPTDASPLGYSRSKWVAEAILDRATAVPPSESSSKPCKFSIFRVGQLSGDTLQGIWNATEAYPMMLASCKETGTLPNLGAAEKLRWLPVDVAAAAIVEGTVGAEAGQASETSGSSGMPDGITDGEVPGGVRVYHVFNHATPPSTWSDLCTWMQKLEPDLQIVPPKDWLTRMENLQMEKPEHAAVKLLGLWKEAYGGRKEVNGDAGAVEENDKGEVSFDSARAKHDMPRLRAVEAVDEEYFCKLWEWIKRTL